MLLKYLPKEKIVEIPDNLKELTEQLASAVMNLDIQMEHEISKGDEEHEQNNYKACYCICF